MKTMFTLLLALLFTTLVQAQPGGERIESLKISFITKALDLTPEEAQQFWPVYNEYQKKLKQLRDERRDKTLEKWRHRETMTEEELNLALDQYLQFQQKEIDLEEEYIQQFRKVLPLKKVAQLIVVEERFKLFLLDELRKRKGGPPGGRH